jgi:hypothetical protein
MGTGEPHALRTPGAKTRPGRSKPRIMFARNAATQLYHGIDGADWPGGEISG